MKDYPPPLKKKKKKKKKKVLDHYLHHDLGMLPLLWCFFAHLLILQYPDHHQNLISSSLYYSGPVHKISSQSVHNFLSNVVQRQTNRQTNATKNITSFAKEVTIQLIKLILETIQLINPKASGPIPAPQSRHATTIIELLLIYSSKMTFEANGTQPTFIVG